MKSIRTILAITAILLGGSLLFISSASALNFQSSSAGPITGLGPAGKGAVTGDFAGDGADDIVSVSESEGAFDGGGIYMLINDGNGAFSETESACDPGEEGPCLNGWDIAGVYKTDFDQDGNPDLLTVRSGLDRYTVWRGDGDGHLEYGGSMDPARPLPSVDSLAIGDVNQDGYPDIAVGYDRGDFGVHVNMGTSGPGQFSPAAPVVQSLTGAGANDDDYFGSVAVGDYNGGGVDLAFGQVACTEVGPGCATPYPASNAVFVADGDGSPINFIGATGNPHPVPAGQVISDIASMQVDVEFTPTGLAVATTSGSGGEIHTYVGNTNLTLVPNPSAEATVGTSSPPRSLTVGNLDSDLNPDLAWIENGTGAGVATQKGNGAFKQEVNGPFEISTDDSEFSSLSIGSFTTNGAPGMAFGGTDPTLGTGSASVLLPAGDFKVDANLDFGNVPTGSTKTLPLRIANDGVFSEYLFGQEIAGDASGAFSIADHGNCKDLAMSPGDTCTISVAFSPRTSGGNAAQLLTHRDGDDTETSLSGTASDPGTPGPGPGPDPDPDPVTRVNLKLASAGKVTRGGRLKVKAILRNTGNQAINGLALKTKVPKKLARAPKRKHIKSIAPGATVKRTFRIKVKPRSKQGRKFIVSVRASLAGKALASARKSVRIRRR